MAYTKFTKEMRKKSLDELNKQIQARKKRLMVENTPGKKRGSKFPFQKLKKEVAILNLIISQRNNRLRK